MDESDRKNANIDAKILVEIDKMRTEYHACTVRRLGSVMRISESTLRLRVDRLRTNGLVGANKVPGSIHLTAEGQARVDAVKAEADPADDADPGLEVADQGGVEAKPLKRKSLVGVVAAAVAAELERRGITAGDSAVPEVEGDRGEATSPEGSPAGTPDPDPPGGAIPSET